MEGGDGTETEGEGVLGREFTRITTLLERVTLGEGGEEAYTTLSIEKLTCSNTIRRFKLRISNTSIRFK